MTYLWDNTTLCWIDTYLSLHDPQRLYTHGFTYRETSSDDHSYYAPSPRSFIGTNRFLRWSSVIIRDGILRHG